MSATSVQESLAVFPEDAAAVCRILMICEDFDAHDLALRICERLLQRLGADVAFAFECLTVKELAEGQSTGQAAGEADIILLSTRGADLPTALRRWLELLPSLRKPSGGALAWIPCGVPAFDDSFHTMADSLDQIARRLEMDFLPPRFALPPDGEVRSFESETWTATAMRQERAGRRAHDHWGLNE